MSAEKDINASLGLTGEQRIDGLEDAVDGTLQVASPAEETRQDLQEAVLLQAQTPFWIDLLVAVSLSAVAVFNGFSMPLVLRLLAVVAVVVAMILQTRYSAAAQMRSNTFLVAALASILSGFLGAFILVRISHAVFNIPIWYPWVILVLISVLVYWGVRSFRSYIANVLGKKK